ITRELDVGAVQGGAIAELVGLGGARSTSVGSGGAVRPRPHLSVASSGNGSGRASANGGATSAVAPVRPSTVSSASARNGRSRTTAPATPAAITSLGGPLSTVRRPTLEQMDDIVDSLEVSMSPSEVAGYMDVREG